MHGSTCEGMPWRVCMCVSACRGVHEALALDLGDLVPVAALPPPQAPCGTYGKSLRAGLCKYLDHSKLGCERSPREPAAV